MSVLGTVCTGGEFPFRGTCLSQSSQEKVGQHLAFFFLSALISRASFWAQSQGSLAPAGLHGPAGLPSSWRPRKVSMHADAGQQGWKPHAVNQLKAEMGTNPHPQWKRRWRRAPFSIAAITNNHMFTGLKQNGCISLQFTVVGSSVGSEAESTFLAHLGSWQNRVPHDGRTEASFPCWLSARPEAASSISKASSPGSVSLLPLFCPPNSLTLSAFLFLFLF